MKRIEIQVISGILVINNNYRQRAVSRAMRAVFGGWHSPNLQMIDVKDKKQQVNPALRLQAGR